MSYAYTLSSLYFPSTHYLLMIKLLVDSESFILGLVDAFLSKQRTDCIIKHTTRNNGRWKISIAQFIGWKHLFDMHCIVRWMKTNLRNFFVEIYCNKTCLNSNQWPKFNFNFLQNIFIQSEIEIKFVFKLLIWFDKLFVPQHRPQK